METRNRGQGTGGPPVGTETAQTRASQWEVLAASPEFRRLITAQQIKALAQLPSRDVLVARLLSVMCGTMVRLVTVLKSPARGLVQALDQIARKKETATGAPSPAAGTEPQA